MNKDVQYSIMLRSDYPTITKICSTSQTTQQICQDPHFWREKVKLLDPNFQEFNDPDPQLIVKTLHEMGIYGSRGIPRAYDLTNNTIMTAVGIGIIASNDRVRTLIAQLKKLSLEGFLDYVSYNNDNDEIILFPIYMLSIFSHDENNSLFVENRSSRQSFLLKIEDNVDDKSYLSVYQSIIMTKFEEEVETQRIDNEIIIKRDADQDWFKEWYDYVIKNNIELARPIIMELITSPEAHAGTWLMSDYF